MYSASFAFPVRGVALLAEGVDRNRDENLQQPVTMRSPSSRRAWIEITISRRSFVERAVALLAEGVDRNQQGFIAMSKVGGRPPRGGRG